MRAFKRVSRGLRRWLFVSRSEDQKSVLTRSRRFKPMNGKEERKADCDLSVSRMQLIWHSRALGARDRIPRCGRAKA